MSFRIALLMLLFSYTVKLPPSDIVKSAAGGANAGANRAISADISFSDDDQANSNISRDSKKSAKPEPQSQIFTGTVEWEYKPGAWECDVPNCDHFALYDDASRNNYELDDARASLPYEGKRVRVTGVLNSKNGTIHLISIEALK